MITYDDLMRHGGIVVGWDRSPVLATDYQIDGMTLEARTPPDEQWVGIRLAPWPMPVFVRLPAAEEE